jgi:hypothetical protein
MGYSKHIRTTAALLLDLRTLNFTVLLPTSGHLTTESAGALSAVSLQVMKVERAITSPYHCC